MNKKRYPQFSFSATKTTEGAGVRIFRSIGSLRLDSLDPFLLLDEMKSDHASDYISGFPDHPHRGFETLTYMIEGEMWHEDNHGHADSLSSGGAQWITAGRGIVHSEIPKQTKGLLWGFQIWINLPASQKMKNPQYTNVPVDSIPVVDRKGVRIKVVAGDFEGTKGGVEGIAAQPNVFDISLPAETAFQFDVDPAWNALIYILDGKIDFDDEAEDSKTWLETGHLAVLGKGDHLEVVSAEGPARFLFLAAQPIGEPIAKYGPFVMNSTDEIQQAIVDYRNGMFE